MEGSMELMQLKYFLEVASSQHMTKSAEKLHIAQPALTQAIHRLQDDIGVPLFEAKGRNIVLTEYGKYLMQSVSPILHQLDKIPEELRRMAKLDRDTIRINVSAASALVTEAIVEYKRQSEVNFSVFQSLSDINDIEVTTKIMYQVARERKEFESSIAEKIFLAVPKNKFEGEKITFGDVQNEGFICLLSKQFRAICDKYCHHVGFKPKVIFESDNPTAVRNAIAAGMGVGFWPEFTWGKAENEHVKLVEIADVPCRRDIVITINPAKMGNENIKAFFDYLKQFFLIKKAAAAK